MAEWVVNASPVITLARAGHLDLLQHEAVQPRLPLAVRDEILAGADHDPARRAIQAGWGEVVRVDPVEAVVEWGLGRGETAVLSSALAHRQWTAVLDDAEARRCARSLGITVVGTLGLVLRAARAKRIPAAAPVVRALRDAGLYLTDAVVARALAEVLGEPWPASGG